MGDFLGGVASRRMSVLAVVAGSHLVSLSLLAVAAPLVGAGRVTAVDLAWGAASGVTGLTGVALLYRAMRLGSMSVVAPLTAVMSAVVPVGVGVGLGERPGAVAVVGVAFAIPAIVLASLAPSGGGLRSRGTGAVVTALAAGVGFGLSLVILDNTGHGSGLWSLLAARAVSAPLALVATLAVARPRGAVVRETAPLVGVVGLIDAAASVSFLLAVRSGLLALVGVLASLYPAVTVGLALVVLRERVTRAQVAGLVLTLVAVALIGLG